MLSSARGWRTYKGGNTEMVGLFTALGKQAQGAEKSAIMYSFAFTLCRVREHTNKSLTPGHLEKRLGR